MKIFSKPLFISVIFNIVLFFSVIHYIRKQGGISLFSSTFSKPAAVSDRYYYAKTSLFNILPNEKEEILFIGDSLTDYCDWYELFGNTNIRNRGIAGDYIEGVSKRVKDALKSKPKKVFLMIGINNLVLIHNTNEEVLTAYDELMSAIKKYSPSSKVFIQSILPVNGNLQEINKNIVVINSGLIQLTKKYNFQYINLHDSFLDKDKCLNAIYSGDGLHLNGKGYDIWKNKISNFVNE
ncbi:MAG: GDSL-type esterase/lipase family protein [Pedobacter sp.]|uniref:GDSL-type esterase/lipase family protein n=1 Tax=Pedobacter sp. TaxID=1411316 RepID=UPI0033931A7F